MGSSHLPCVTAALCSTAGALSSAHCIATPFNCGTWGTWGAMNAGAFFVSWTRMLSSWVCCLRSATCAAMTRCLSAIRVHWAQLQSLHGQYRLWPFNHDTLPWLRHRAHFGMRGGFRSEKVCWITKEVSVMPRSLKFSHLRDPWIQEVAVVFSPWTTIAMSHLTLKELTDVSLLFNSIFYHSRRSRLLC